MNKRKILMMALAICMIAILAVGGSLAYFIDTMNATNTIVIGNVDAEMYESKYHRGAPTGYLSITGQPNPTTDDDIIEDSKVYEDYLKNSTLMPFNLKADHRVQSMFEECTVAKNAYVKNTGDKNDCFVRVRYIIPADIAQYLDIFYVDTQFITADSDIAQADARTLDNTDKKEPIITAVTSSGANFTQQGTEPVGENYVATFIYAERLTPGEMTLYSPISKVTMIPTVTEETIEALNLENRQFEIKVEADVIQADGFLNALEAFAAFDNQEAVG